MSKRKLTLANNPLFSGPPLRERENLAGTPHTPYREIQINLIERDPKQPRVSFDEERLNELASSIRTYGVLNPILVKPSKTPGRYIIISGERRFRASQLVGLQTIPCLIDAISNDSEERTLAMQLVENIQRADLTPLERANAIGALKDNFNLSVREIADKLGISKSMVQRSLDILKLPPDLLNALREGASESKILLLAEISDPEIRATYLKDLESLTRNQLKKNIESGSQDITEKRYKELSAEDNRIIEDMRRALGMRVDMIRFKERPEGGRLEIDFYSEDDLKLLFRRLVSE
ncbi:MAG TPA: ParB/RepB/Spo0J family partition protein [Oligoflexia bacterium]|nr:ParB/RepB/Spo0J family partition protein [Oligoflexia bacterium]HMP27434.1 ParB/RepB/Spo0J family partition protein [Oligoflexia bacterium]